MSPDQTALLAHLEAINAKTQAWVDVDPTNRCAGMMTTDMAHWAGYGIFTVEQYERYELHTSIWDLYKSVHGIRPRWMNFAEMSLEELQETYKELCEESRRAYEEEVAFIEKHGYSPDELEDLFYAAAEERSCDEAKLANLQREAMAQETPAEREEEYFFATEKF